LKWNDFSIILLRQTSKSLSFEFNDDGIDNFGKAVVLGVDSSVTSSGIMIFRVVTITFFGLAVANFLSVTAEC
jgi:hypothetical protein